MEEESTYYAVEVDEAAAILRLTPDRVQEMLLAGELEGIPPGGTVHGDWKVLLPAAPNLEQPAPLEEHRETPSKEQEDASPKEEPEQPAHVPAPPAASEAAVQDPDEPLDEPLDEPADEVDEDVRVEAGDSGWTTTKQAAKVLGVSRRSVQGYVRRGLLEAREEGVGVNKTFLVSIDSLNALRDRRKHEAEGAAKFAGVSAEEKRSANLYANTGEALRHAIERVEARTAEATELRVRLEITEKAQSTLRAELEEARRRSEEIERERDELRRELAALKERRRASPEKAGPSQKTATEEHRGPQEARGATEKAVEGLRGSAESHPTTEGAQHSPQRPAAAGQHAERRRGRLWRRLFGG